MESGKPMYIINVEGVVYHEGRYLMIQRGAEEKQDPLALAMPGGKVEGHGILDGALEDTLRREIMEETGVEICDEIHYLESKSFLSSQGEPVVDVVFLCRYQSGEPRINDPHEVEALTWMSAKEIYAHPRAEAWTHQSIRKAEAFLKSINQRGEE
jgi:8-oxo-dGTP diphosphatase